MRTTTAVLVLAALGGTPAGAQTYPVRPVRVVVPYTPGGGGDILARMLAPRLQEKLGQNIVVDNRPGGGTVLGTELVARAAPDGHTLLLNTAALTINPSLMAKLPYDLLADLAPVSLVVLLPNLLVVNPAVPAQNVREFIDLARARPDQLAYGSSGTGTGAHLAGALFCSMAGIRMVHVPYKGGSALLPDLIANQVQASFATLPASLPQVKAGRLRALAVTSARRAAAVPDVPTVVEGGLAGYDAANWQAVVVPAGTPQAVVRRLEQEFVAAVQAPELKERLIAQGFDPVGSTARALGELFRTEIPKWSRVIRESGAKAD